MDRRDFIKFLAAGAAGVRSREAFGGRSMGPNIARPNVVLMVSDDHGADALGCYGNKVVQTPNLDALAAEGTRFTHAFCTSASCSPSRSVILTGLHNHATGQYGLGHSYHRFSTSEKVQSLPVLMNQNGYRTGRVGKYHVGPESVYKFDVTIPGRARNSVRMAENCADFINADDARPFFLCYCTDDPHRSNPFKSTPYDKPNAFGNNQRYRGIEPVEYDPADVAVPSFLPDTKECRAELAQYYQSVSRMDAGIGRLMEIIRKSGKWDNTVVIYISDNGIAFPGAKTTVYDPGLRLPCIVRDPRQKKRGVVSRAMISWTDITPTILDFACGEPNPKNFHGRSFFDILDEENPAGWDDIYASHTFHEVTMYYPMRVVRERRYKLIWNLAYEQEYPFASDLWHSPTWQGVIRAGGKKYGKRTIASYMRRPEFELYDLQNDPDEIDNLADKAKYAKKLAELQAKLKEFQRRTRDPWILMWERRELSGKL